MREQITKRAEAELHWQAIRRHMIRWCQLQAEIGQRDEGREHKTTEQKEFKL